MYSRGKKLISTFYVNFKKFYKTLIYNKNMHIRTYVNCFGNIVLQMPSVHCSFRRSSRQSETCSQQALANAIPKEAKTFFSSNKMYLNNNIT